MTRSTVSDPTLPRVLCLHGGGTNGLVFRMQCRAIIAALREQFRLVFAEGPFASDPHEAIIAVYGDCGPFKSWQRLRSDDPEVTADESATRIADACRGVMEADEGTGPWVAVMGFSQGAKMAASLLWSQERLREEDKRTGTSRAPLLADFKFGILMAGSPPTVSLDPRIRAPVPRFAVDAARPTLKLDEWPASAEGEHALRTIPTLHVHGLLDPGLGRHRRLLETYCAEGTTRLIEWQGDHRLPIKSHDVKAVTDVIMELAQETRAI
ncbi:citrinin biosynthesis oxidoreductase CtnB [Purpureocillium lavendulum]|uniref:Citrinin biosynthesis oxidoreductase CtnB n=1 Tax=Purpureocillium lavendulum TaxID=1247861 RepID=A0AB34FJ90_9HYPO|nr:citrinin biosynthesis oxidoreductase CtnB [Purpureocillium lavendulum]